MSRCYEELIKGIDVFKDGDAWCAVIKEDFTNIQESLCGFGDTKTEAIIELLFEIKTSTSTTGE